MLLPIYKTAHTSADTSTNVLDESEFLPEDDGCSLPVGSALHLTLECLRKACRTGLAHTAAHGLRNATPIPGMTAYLQQLAMPLVMCRAPCSIYGTVARHDNTAEAENPLLRRCSMCRWSNECFEVSTEAGLHAASL